MVTFSDDMDILKYEPILFGELHLPGQVLASGTGGTLSGTTFTASGADFINASARDGGVVYLRSVGDSLDGVFEIVSVDSSTQLTVSVIRGNSGEAPISPPAATDIYYRVSTLRPQANEVSFQLTEYFGIRPGNPEGVYEAGDILDTIALKKASVFGTISSVYAMLAGKTNEDNCWKKSQHYQTLFEKARQRCQLGIDADGDGKVDVTKIGASGRLVRD